MQSNRGRDTAPEVAVRAALQRAGLRFRKHFRALPGKRGDVDIAFPRARIAIFIDGCFWHSCPQHATRPATNLEWWKAKLDATIDRDQRTNADLTDANWTVLRFWEHESVANIVEAVAASRASVQTSS
jgi:DNA mismatch endonuclease (patch repair protein)